MGSKKYEERVKKGEAELGKIYQNFEIIDYKLEEHILYLTKCLVCDSENWRLLNAIKLKKTNKCGCGGKATNINDLTGRQFGRLTVISPTERRSNSGQIIWLCKCSCGRNINVQTTMLSSGAQVSCGCYGAERRHAALEKERILTHVENTNLIAIKPRKLRKDNKTGVRGVKLCRSGRWQALITFQGNVMNLGRYDTLEEAAAARKEAEDKYFKPMLEKYKDRL